MQIPKYIYSSYPAFPHPVLFCPLALIMIWAVPLAMTTLSSLMRWQENLSLAPEKGSPRTPESSLLPLMRSSPWWSLQATSFPPPSLLVPGVYLPALLSLLLSLSLMQTQDTQGDKDEEARVPVLRSLDHAEETGQRETG